MQQNACVERVAFAVAGLHVSEAGQADEPAEFLPVFNDHPDFLDASTLHNGVRAFTEDDMAQFLWQNEVMEDSHCLAVRSADAVVGTVTLLVPHPREKQPWIGLFLVGAGVSSEAVAGPLLTGLEQVLAADGWDAVFVAPMTSQREALAWWQDQGYAPVDVRLDNDKREVQVLRKDLAR